MEVLKRLCGWQKWLDEERPKIFLAAQKDILETMADDLDKKANILADQKLKGLLYLSELPDIIRIKGKQVFINGELVDDARVAAIKADAEFFAVSDLWKILNDSVSEEAKRIMFVLGDNAPEQLKTGRTILYTLSTQKNAVDAIKKLSTT
jgi:hypothetical protein